MPLELERLTVSARNIALAELAEALVRIVRKQGGVADRREALDLLATQQKISRSEVTLVLAYAKAERLLMTGSKPTQLSLVS